jgi:DNA-binding transcriptional LysR family regulator
MDRYAAMLSFVRVVESGSFSAAARQLRIGQPAVSKTIAQLESRLGVRLLLRTTRGLAPTEAGLRFYERAKASLAEADEADLAARGEGQSLSGILRASAATTFARLHVVPRLPEFLDGNPDLSIDLILDDRMIDLVEEGVDVALRMGGLQDSSATARRLATSPRSVIASRDYVARRGPPSSPADLAGHEVVTYTQGRFGTWSFRKDTAEISVAVAGRVRASSAEGTRAAVLAGLGITIASDWMFAPELASGAAVKLLTEWVLPPVDLWAVFPTGRMASTKARAFADFVAAVATQPPIPDRATP